MAFCRKCGNEIMDGAKFCPVCGEEIESSGGRQTKNGYKTILQNLNNTEDTTEQFSDEDIQKSRVMAVLAYFGILVFIPVFCAAKSSPYARYHCNQGLTLLLFSLVYSLGCGILNSIVLAVSWKLYFVTKIFALAWIGFALLAIIGILNAASGKAKELPVIGKYRLFV